MNYAEAAYFDGNHCAHVAAMIDYRHAQYRNRQAREILRRRGVL